MYYAIVYYTTLLPQHCILCWRPWIPDRESHKKDIIDIVVIIITIIYIIIIIIIIIMFRDSRCPSTAVNTQYIMLHYHVH